MMPPSCSGRVSVLTTSRTCYSHALNPVLRPHSASSCASTSSSMYILLAATLTPAESPLRKCFSLRPVHCASSSSGMQSFDSEDELDSSLSSELNRYKDPGHSQKAASHLDLLWKIGKPRRPETCTTCEGARERECDWCHGTGCLTVGDAIFRSTAQFANRCPVCKGGGYTPCQHCRGTGFRAQWLGGSTAPLES